jgi:predicted outer membrane repeat protein
LREATNYIHGGGTITFAPALSGGTIVLASEIDLEKDMTIDGSSLGSAVSISGNDAVRAFVVAADSVVSLDSLHIIHGYAGSPSSFGGGLRTYGDLFIENCTFQDNYAENYGGAISVELDGSATIAGSTFANNSGGSGGAIYARYSLAIANTTFTDNTATNFGGAIGASYSDHIHPDLEIEASTFTSNDSDSGGAIGTAGDFDLTITGSTFSGNSASSNGGAVDHAGYALTITDSSFEGNSAALSGGAVYQRGHSMNMTGSLLSANTALDGAGIYYNGDYPGSASVNGSTIQNNAAAGNGGGIYSRRGSLSVWDSTISGNSASVGGGIFQDGYPVRLHNTTLFGNTAVDGGGFSNTSGPAAYFSLSIYNSTFSNNGASGVGGGFLNYQAIVLQNTIIANSSSGGDCQNLGSFTSNLHNLIEDGSCSPDYTGDPVLGPLADNGGPTETMALLAGSPAIDAGYDASCESTDQRGVIRPQGPHCDIGAYEYEFPYSLYLPLIAR